MAGCLGAAHRGGHADLLARFGSVFGLQLCSVVCVCCGFVICGCLSGNMFYVVSLISCIYYECNV